MTTNLSLVCDGVENPHNRRALLDTADALGCGCLFRGVPDEEMPDGAGALEADVFASTYRQRIAFDNGPQARSIHDYKLPKRASAALVVGNERRGITPGMRSLTNVALEIPMVSRKVNCLNVTAAAGVGLYFLLHGRGRKTRTVRNPERDRPELLLVGGDDHVEVGSALRSACAFGWRRCMVEDRGGVWFGSERWRQLEGRAASRASKNTTRVVPVGEGTDLGFRQALVVTTGGRGEPLRAVDLAAGPETVIVVQDGPVDPQAIEARGYAESIRFVTVDAAGVCYRVLASIVLAEAARQVGISD